VEYAVAAASAPPGWRHFTRRDVDRLPPAVRRHELSKVPPQDLRLLEAGDPAAEERLLRAMFWTLTYHLEPERWDQLAQVEPIAPAIIEVLPTAARALDIGAGSGRLTLHLAQRVEQVVAVEPSSGLLELLRQRLPRVHAVAAWAEALPIRDGWSQLTAACGALGPESNILDELERVTGEGGVIALINPEDPEWFEARGWNRHDVAPARVKPHDQWIDGFFGPPDPPRVLVTKIKSQ
jgi:SAM-dependent methyltransferase